MKLPHADPTGFFALLQQVVRMRYGQPGTWGHGRASNETRKGPGRRRMPVQGPGASVHPAGTKLVKRFIRDASSENVQYRRTYAALTGKQYGVVELP